MRDLDQDLLRVSGRRVESVFFGGGTPSLFHPESIAHILRETRTRLPLADEAEITLEANPGTVERGRFAEYKTAGVTRLSIGVQSFNAGHLQLLGRIHSSDEAVHAAEEAHAAGLSNFNLDLMYGLPEQDIAQACEDVNHAVLLEPAHISHYQLTLEPNTLFYAHPPAIPDEDLIWQMQQACQSLLKDNHYAQYEISAYARTGRQCRHNLNYWRFGDYLGIGAGAHSKLTDTGNNHIVRISKVKHPDVYLRSAGTAEIIGTITEVGDDDRIFEFMLNRLRLREGFTAADFESATGLSFIRVEPVLERNQNQGLLQMTQGQWAPTERGYTYLNDLQSQFLPASVRYKCGAA